MQVYAPPSDGTIVNYLPYPRHLLGTHHRSSLPSLRSFGGLRAGAPTYAQPFQHVTILLSEYALANSGMLVVTVTVLVCADGIPVTATHEDRPAGSRATGL